MRTEREKMLAGELYDPLDPELVRARERARDLCQDLNATREKDQDARRRILKELFGRGGESVFTQRFKRSGITWSPGGRRGGLAATAKKVA
jgi:maltose O-acetyltransferase